MSVKMAAHGGHQCLLPNKRLEIDANRCFIASDVRWIAMQFGISKGGPKTCTGHVSL